MESYPQHELDDIARDLSGLDGVRAPATLLPGVLARLGLRDSYVRVETPIGPSFVSYSKAGISLVLSAESPEAFERAFHERTGRTVTPAMERPAWLKDGRLAPSKGRSHLTFDLRGASEFQLAVLGKAREIPYGEVRSYAWVAKEIGRPGAVRAVGTALSRNPVPLLIPCHRVVRGDGQTGEYVFGAEAKRAVLQAEGLDLDELERLARAGIRYLGSATTRVYCLPTCGHMMRVKAPNHVSFHSADEAVAAGYRACKVCRPAA